MVKRAKIILTPLLLIVSTMLTGCPGDQPKAVGDGGAASGLPSTPTSTTSTGTGTGTTSSVTGYESAGAVKVIFNKQSFYSNQAPNTQGCAGDAKYFYSPLTDRRVPVHPSWVKNIAIELTNSNALYGPSLATSCGLSGLGSSPASNCASFDDLQPLDGSSSRSVLVGGYGCSSGIASCSPTFFLNDIWNLYLTDVSTGTWNNQSIGLPAVPPSLGPGIAWAGGGYDEIHDEFYLYGGVTATASPSSTAAMNSKIMKIVFSSDTTVSSAVPPVLVTPGNQRSYAGWAHSSYDANVAPYLPPPALIGPTFTYGSRRDPTSKSWCRSGDAITGSCIPSGVLGATRLATALNEHSDYFLLAGGLGVTAGNAVVSNRIYMYKPHGFSNDISTAGGAPLPVLGGDWSLLYTNPAVTNTANVMSIVDLTTTGGTSNSPFVVSATAWNGLAYHRSVYDPMMNRFYIYGGLQQGAAANLFASAPSLSSGEIWIYDPPALGRRATGACFSNSTPDNKPLPSTASVNGAGVVNPTSGAAANSFLFGGAQANLGPNQNYISSKYVFPAGGCMQRILTPVGSTPSARFEQAMAFDRDDRMMMVFGGCVTPAAIPGTAVPATVGDPTTACTSRAALLNDTWIYLPPTTTEVLPKTSAALPVSVLPNIFGTDFWLDYQPIYAGDGTSLTNGYLATPTSDQVLGTWIQLNPVVSGAAAGSLTTTNNGPSARVSANMVYDRAQRRFLLQGGFGCANGDTTCSNGVHALNDLWAFKPPASIYCSRTNATCTGSSSVSHTETQGVWTLLRADIAKSDAFQPTQRKGATMAYSMPQFANGDEFYTVRDSTCEGQGPIASTDSSTSKQFVGAIYVDIDRAQFSAKENLVLNLRFLPYDKNTKLPGFTDNGTPLIPTNFSDSSSTNDQAIIRVQFLSNPLKLAEQIQASVQPRYHEFISGAPVLGNETTYLSGASGQITEKQIFVPLQLDPSINLIKIERVQGSVKFYEMTVSKY